MDAKLTTVMVEEGVGLPLTTQKVIVLVTTAIVTFGSGLVPFKLVDALKKNKDRESQAKWREMLSFSSCFAAAFWWCRRNSLLCGTIFRA